VRYRYGGFFGVRICFSIVEENLVMYSVLFTEWQLMCILFDSHISQTSSTLNIVKKETTRKKHGSPITGGHKSSFYDTASLLLFPSFVVKLTSFIFRRSTFRVDTKRKFGRFFRRQVETFNR